MQVIEIKEIPKNSDIEVQILAMILKNDKLIRDVVDNVNSTMFYEPFHQEIFKAMLYLHYNNIGIGYETIIDRFKSLGLENVDEVTGYLIELGGANITTGSFESKADLLVDYYRKRELYNHYKNRLQKDMTGIASANLVKEIEALVDGMGINSNIEVTDFENYVDTWMNDQEDETPVNGFKTGFNQLDEDVLLLDTNLMIIGARPSTGKSAFATNLVKNFCLQGKTPLFVSLEMGKKEFMNRLIANMAKVEAKKIKRKLPKTPQEWQRIMTAKEKIKKFKFKFYDEGNLKIEQLVGLCRFLKKKGELDVLVIDYIQLLQSHQYKNQRTQQVGYISHQLKGLAMELDIPVIALAQLNRGVIDNGKPREPQMSDLRESGDLENDANIILMLHTDDVEQKFQHRRFIKLFIRKNRDGKLGTLNFSYYGDNLNFVEQVWDADRHGFVDVIQDELGGVTYDEDLPF